MSENNADPALAPEEQVELIFPVEFFIKGVPLSLQASSHSREAWKTIVTDSARQIIGLGKWATDRPVFVTILYFPDGPMIGDIDNIVKPILDALKQLIYLDDRQVARVWVEKFEPENQASFSEPTATLAAALDEDTPVVYVRIGDESSEAKWNQL